MGAFAIIKQQDMLREAAERGRHQGSRDHRRHRKLSFRRLARR